MAKLETMREYEKSPQDKKSDKAHTKVGIKEGSKKEQALDRKELARLNAKRGKK